MSMIQPNNILDNYLFYGEHSGTLKLIENDV